MYETFYVLSLNYHIFYKMKHFAFSEYGDGRYGVMIIIYEPEIKKNDKEVRLQAVFEVDGQKDVLWFEVEEKYSIYLTNERADAFLVGLLWYALKNGHDIKVLSPMSERLYYTVNKYLVPVIAEIHGYKTIKVMCNQLAAKPISNAGAVGTGLSCGIDSFSTICDHMGDGVPGKYKITHFTFFNVGSNGDFGGKQALNLFEERTKIAKACADELGKELIMVNSNLSEILHMSFRQTDTLRSMSAVLALQKLFKVYYHSSTVHIKDFRLSKSLLACSDIFNLNMLSTENTSLFSSCANYTRVDKTRMVAKFEPSYKYLNVCTKDKFNCGKCSKCLRTLLTLEIIGAIDKYAAVFPLDVYRKKRPKYIAKVLANRDTDIWMKEIYHEMVRTNYLLEVEAAQEERE
ncbi:hypothetical protein ACFOU2_22205 [Bacillus songklensis]|uniref:Uncharacterized protein n=1 Tax=Bacillus songklensis TaxID=1069116 RepID=A0ABV8B971_9BACI